MNLLDKDTHIRFCNMIDVSTHLNLCIADTHIPFWIFVIKMYVEKTPIFFHIYVKVTRIRLVLYVTHSTKHSYSAVTFSNSEKLPTYFYLFFYPFPQKVLLSKMKSRLPFIFLVSFIRVHFRNVWCNNLLCDSARISKSQ